MPGDILTGSIVVPPGATAPLADACLGCGLGLILQPDGSYLFGVLTDDIPPNPADPGTFLRPTCDTASNRVVYRLTGASLVAMLNNITSPTVRNNICTWIQTNCPGLLSATQLVHYTDVTIDGVVYSLSNTDTYINCGPPTTPGMVRIERQDFEAGFTDFQELGATSHAVQIANRLGNIATFTNADPPTVDTSLGTMVFTLPCDQDQVIIHGWVQVGVNGDSGIPTNQMLGPVPAPNGPVSVVLARIDGGPLISLSGPIGDSGIWRFTEHQRLGGIVQPMLAGPHTVEIVYRANNNNDIQPGLSKTVTEFWFHTQWAELCCGVSGIFAS
jgi:hypothetical protein